MKKYIIKLNGKVYEIEMEEVVDGQVPTIAQTENPAQAKSLTQSPQPVSGGESIDCPMPGTIANVAVNVGDKVKKNQVLLVLEAMKMENEIVSPVDGTVVAVNVSKGQSVNPGQSLVQIG